MGVDVSAMSDEQGAAAAIDAIRQLARDVKIPAGLEQLGVRADDLDVLANNALRMPVVSPTPGRATHARSSPSSARHKGRIARAATRPFIG